MQRTLWAIALGLCASVAHAQNAASPVEVSGKIEAVQGNRIAIKALSGVVYNCELTKTWTGPDNLSYSAPAEPSIIVTGTEDARNLRPGHAIQFQAVLAGKKTVVGDVTAATLVTLAPDARVGILSAEPADAPAGGDDKKAPANLENCLILGTITKAKSNMLTVTAPGMKALNFKLTDDATITVSGSDLRLARIGDQITAKGFAIALPLVAVQDVKIEHTPAPEKVPRGKPKVDDVARPNGKGPRNPFGVGDPEDAAADPAAPAKPKVKLELIKTN
jgi:hypothetical protein